MEKTTITINGEECVILPAPKGAFLKIDGVIYPDFVPFVAVNPRIKKDDEWDFVDMYALRYYDDGHLELNCEQSVLTEIGNRFLQESYEENKRLMNTDKWLSFEEILDLYHPFPWGDMDMMKEVSVFNTGKKYENGENVYVF